MLRFEHVTYTYAHQTRPAVEDVHFSVRPGELVLCTGASGCGKSTLIRLANGLCPHYFQGQMQGRVLVEGVDTARRGIADVARVAGTLFQDPEQQFFALTVEDELAFALEWQGLSRKHMREAVDRVAQDFGLDHLRGASLHTLSEGQKQKVGLASLCAQRPRALVLDEPSANLDPEATADLAHKLAALKRAGMAIFVVDHRLYWLEGVADRVVVMREGRVCAQGDFALLYHADLRAACGLRAASVPDVRRSLPSACDPDVRTTLPSGAAQALLSVANLTHAHKKAAPLYENISFSLPAGITALLGDNGTGKTTLARLLAGLNSPNSGTVSMAGEELTARQRLRRTGLVLQNADHQLHMRTVLEEVETCLAFACQSEPDAPEGRESPASHGSAVNAGGRDKPSLRAEALALLELFHLHPLAQRHPQSLSGGQKQRLVIACALAKRPQVLVLDEPTSGLDGANMQRLADVLEQQSARGLCVLLITHDLELLHKVCAQALRLPLLTPVKQCQSHGSIVNKS